MDELPDDVRDYLIDDPLRYAARLTPYSPYEPLKQPVSFTEYFDKMEQISKALRNYLARQPGGFTFIKRVEHQLGMKLRFAITSALSEAPDSDNSVSSNHDRLRVIDPLLWALHDGMPITRRPLSILTDLGGPYGQTLLSYTKSLFDATAQAWHVATYIVGRNDIVSDNDTPPNEVKHQLRPSLIGPVLELLNKDAIVVLITQSELIDLGDFRTSDWLKRCVIVDCTGVNGQADGWPNVIKLNQNNDITPVIERLSQI